MIKKLRLLLSISALFFTSAIYAQVGQGSLKGKVVDKANGEPIPFANIVVELNGVQAGGATTDFDGNYFIKPLSPGKYTVKASYVGYQGVQIDGVVVGDRIAFLNISMTQGVQLKTFEKVEYEVPLIDKGNTTSGGTVTRDDIAKMPGRSAESVAITVGGIFSKDGERGNVRGSREDATDTYIDGVKVRGSSSIPNSAIEQVSVMLGGLDAQYGDATGGVISITTRGASREYFGGVEIVTSQLFDSYGYNLLGFNVAGPLFMKKDTANPEVKIPKLGFFLSGELRSEKDPRPSAIGSIKLKDEVLRDLEQNPLRPSGQGQGTFQNASFVRASDFERIPYRQDVGAHGILLQGKLDYNINANTTLTFGGTYDYSYSREVGLSPNSNYRSGLVYRNTLFNSKMNPEIIDNTYRIWGRFTQKLSSSESNSQESATTIKNAYYSIQADYSRVLSKVQDKRHKDQIFNYGYVGQFNTLIQPSFEFGYDSTYNEYGYIQNAYNTVAYSFVPSNVNPLLSQYTENYYQLYDTPGGNYENPLQVENGGGLLNGLQNGAFKNSVYDLWTNPGAPFNRYSTMDNSQFRIRVTGSADIKDHNILVGFEFEQRSDNYFQVNPAGLWWINRQYFNNHIRELDKTKVTRVEAGTYPLFLYDRLISYQSPDDSLAFGQTFVDYNFRKNNGMDVSGTDYIDVDSYDPSKFKLEYYSPDELLNQGNSYVTYNGYDHTGKKLTSQPNFDDFFTAKDEYGNYKRQIGAFQPIYMAGYIQDKFTFEDLIFNIGLRVDRFDANQKVLKDKYSIFETKKAGEVSPDRPGNIGEDFVVYVSDIDNPATNNIVGYRDGNKWFDADGRELSNPSVLYTASGAPAPWLLDPSKRNSSTDIRSSAFTDYVPQVTLMPRISFSFPISDEALFFAHYDILSKRPSNALRLDPTDYLFIQTSTAAIANPNLKPEQTIDYELGFQQKLTNSSSLKLAAFYRELRNMIQYTAVIGAFPKAMYYSYDNIDFGTVKGATISYDLRRTNNVSFRLSYTLQFADGTGSSANQGLNLVNATQQNIRILFPLDFDQRHAFQAVADYRYGSGRDYNGPMWKDKQILANTGLNITFFGGSGTPYTAQKNVTIDAAGGGRSLVKGGLNGARLPWQFRADMRLDRDFDMYLGKGEEKDGKKKIQLNVYLLVLNVFDAQNIINVYKATGNPDDDGYLAAAEFQNSIISQNDPQSYRDLYTAKVNSPYNYSLPRRIRLGVMLNF
jgi:outer membrane receptor protein involved in Fe transport